MAYQNVGAPRFYINIPEWLSSHGVMPLTESGNKRVLRTLPVKPTDAADSDLMTEGMPGMTENGFIAALGHNFATKSVFYHLYTLSGGANASVNSMEEVVNATIQDDGKTVFAEKDGFSISTFNTNNREIWIIWVRDDFGGGTVGSMVIGTYYDMPHSPNLNLTMTREMDGAKRVRTKGGSDLINYKYIKSPPWGSSGAWDMSYYGSHKYSRVGRRTWSLSFSHLDRGDIFGPNQSLVDGGIWGPQAGPDAADLDSSNQFETNLLDDDNFFSQVIHKTNGGQLPFIFQPNRDNNNPDNFAIAKLDMKSFKFKQTANGIYDINLKIKEVW